MHTIHIQFGKGLTTLIQDGQRKLLFLEKIKALRGQFLKEFEVFPPSYTLEYVDTMGTYEYAFHKEDFGRVVYSIESWDAKKEETNLTQRLLFHYERFLRKWIHNAPDVAIEEKLKEIPILLEFGEAWVDVVEETHFYQELQTLANQHGICLEEPPYWESDYISQEGLIVYIYGKDHFIHTGVEKTKDVLLQEILQPILQENRLRIQHT